jgi:transcriptional regulator with XRE-family HTH domain
MATRRKPNAKYLGSEASSVELDEAIDQAIERSPNARADFLAANLAMDLQRARQKAGLTQAQVAERAAVPQSFIARLENPTSSKRPTLISFAKAAAALNLTLTLAKVVSRAKKRTRALRVAARPARATASAARRGKAVGHAAAKRAAPTKT